MQVMCLAIPVGRPCEMSSDYGNGKSITLKINVCARIFSLQGAWNRERRVATLAHVKPAGWLNPKI